MGLNIAVVVPVLATIESAPYQRPDPQGTASSICSDRISRDRRCVAGDRRSHEAKGKAGRGVKWSSGTCRVASAYLQGGWKEMWFLAVTPRFEVFFCQGLRRFELESHIHCHQVSEGVAIHGRNLRMTWLARRSTGI